MSAFCQRGHLDKLAARPRTPFERRLRLERLEARRLLTITVDTLTDEMDEMDGRIDDGDISLRDAIAAASSAETIDFSVTGTIALTLGEIKIEDKLTIDGPGADSLTIDAGGQSRIFRIDVPNSFSDVEIRDLTLQNGEENSEGGGAIFLKENLTLRNAVITGNNTTLSGGAIRSETSGQLLVEDSEFTGNTAGDDGGAISSSFTNITIRSSTIAGNSATTGAGGGIYLNRGDWKLRVPRSPVTVLPLAAEESAVVFI